MKEDPLNDWACKWHLVDNKWLLSKMQFFKELSHFNQTLLSEFLASIGKQLYAFELFNFGFVTWLLSHCL